RTYDRRGPGNAGRDTDPARGRRPDRLSEIPADRGTSPKVGTTRDLMWRLIAVSRVDTVKPELCHACPDSISTRRPGRLGPGHDRVPACGHGDLGRAVRGPGLGPSRFVTGP